MMPSIHFLSHHLKTEPSILIPKNEENKKAKNSHINDDTQSKYLNSNPSLALNKKEIESNMMIYINEIGLI